MPTGEVTNYQSITVPLTWDELNVLTPVNLDQHVFACGITGSGKSTIMTLKVLSLERQLIQHQVPSSNYKILVVDTKDTPHGIPWSQGNFNFKGAVRIRSWKDFRPSRIDNRIVIYRPDPDSSEANPESFQEMFAYLRSLKLIHGGEKPSEAGLLPMRIFIDELKDIVGDDTSRNVYLSSMAELLTQGRSTWQTLWVGTQNPVFLDSDIKRNMPVKFAFYLDAVSDRETMAKQMGVKAINMPIPDQHGFWYANRQLAYLQGRAMYISGNVRAA